MIRTVFLSLVLFVSAALPATANPMFALVVEAPGFEASLVNLGGSPITVAGYTIQSPSGSLDPTGWVSLADAAGPEIVAALGPGADDFVEAGTPSSSFLAELNSNPNPLVGGTWQPDQSWPIGAPLGADPILDLTFTYYDPVRDETFQGPVIYQQIPEPAAVWLLCGSAIGVTRSLRRRIG